MLLKRKLHELPAYITSITKMCDLDCVTVMSLPANLLLKRSVATGHLHQKAIKRKFIIIIIIIIMLHG